MTLSALHEGCYSSRWVGPAEAARLLAELTHISACTLYFFSKMRKPKQKRSPSLRVWAEIEITEIKVDKLEKWNKTKRAKNWVQTKSGKIRGPLMLGCKQLAGFIKLWTSVVGLGRKKKKKRKTIHILNRNQLIRMVFHAMKTCELCTTQIFWVRWP